MLSLATFSPLSGIVLVVVALVLKGEAAEGPCDGAWLNFDFDIRKSEATV